VIPPKLTERIPADIDYAKQSRTLTACDIGQLQNIDPGKYETTAKHFLLPHLTLKTSLKLTRLKFVERK